MLLFLTTLLLGGTTYAQQEVGVEVSLYGGVDCYKQLHLNNGGAVIGQRLGFDIKRYLSDRVYAVVGMDYSHLNRKDSITAMYMDRPSTNIKEFKYQQILQARDGKMFLGFGWDFWQIKKRHTFFAEVVGALYSIDQTKTVQVINKDVRETYPNYAMMGLIPTLGYRYRLTDHIGVGLSCSLTEFSTKDSHDKATLNLRLSYAF